MRTQAPGSPGIYLQATPCRSKERAGSKFPHLPRNGRISTSVTPIITVLGPLRTFRSWFVAVSFDTDKPWYPGLYPPSRSAVRSEPMASYGISHESCSSGVNST